MGMKAAILTNSPHLRYFGNKLGYSVLQYEELIGEKHGIAQGSVDAVTNPLLKLLGFEEGKVIETSPFDLVFVHIGDGEQVDAGIHGVINNDIEYVNALVGSILHVAQTGSEIGSRLHLSLVMSYGDISNFDGSHLSIRMPKDDENSDLLKLFPRQSYTMRGECPRDNVRYMQIQSTMA